MKWIDWNLHQMLTGNLKIIENSSVNYINRFEFKSNDSWKLENNENNWK